MKKGRKKAPHLIRSAFDEGRYPENQNRMQALFRQFTRSKAPIRQTKRRAGDGGFEPESPAFYAAISGMAAYFVPFCRIRHPKYASSPVETTANACFAAS